ncbi:MAG: Cof-type HAD-IIB family hydrolase [Bacillota bacterium]|nr:Cof-type HAD-IIB family hydrolase [Bacillota bacterium]
MGKIVFFDIDGTLLDHDKKLPLSTKKALWELKNNGVYVAIATGRAPFMFEDLREELEIDSFVSFNGQYVVFENRVIYENPLNHKELGRFLDESKHNSHPLVFENEKGMRASVKHHPYIETSMGSLKFPHPEEDSAYFIGKKIHQAMIFCEEGEENFYIEKYPHFEFVRWHPFSLDVMPKGGSKAEGIKKMIEQLSFDLKDVYAFGDGLNDIEMLKAVGTGVAMGNGVPEVKKHANLITTDVAEKGIWNGLKELNLI